MPGSARIRGGASGEGEVETLQGAGSVEFVGHPVFGDFELHGSDGAEHGCLITAQVRAQHLDDAFVVELFDAASELFVLRGVLGADDHEVFG